MGHIHQSVRLSAEKTATVSMLVDTGATFSVIPDALARAVGVKRLRRSVAITLADGRRVRLDASTAIFRIGKREAPATILIGGVVEPILGVETLEALGLTEAAPCAVTKLLGSARRLPIDARVASRVEAVYLSLRSS
jgi:predicted aspartyl protease